jgi:dihydrodipicolinate reductase
MCIVFSCPTRPFNIHAAVKPDATSSWATGWYQHLPELKNGEVGLLYSANFSLGMNYFFRLVRRAGS